eukprot:CAMPEP_0115876930 /NCGR_PEP_ID=MMETSP0287-20121206/25942_1 /TAXON_ID=412157 /ORGANISM="Chrysochromulina rotalis, Strain UIO044" /LENGTH=227 /DNA_ID=CAMNT_0003332391 /DNA_START=78 /DNA_END=757 /DNA_ORIENTATION=-
MPALALGEAERRQLACLLKPQRAAHLAVELLDGEQQHGREHEHVGTHDQAGKRHEVGREAKKRLDLEAVERVVHLEEESEYEGAQQQQARGDGRERGRSEAVWLRKEQQHEVADAQEQRDEQAHQAKPVGQQHDKPSQRELPHQLEDLPETVLLLILGIQERDGPAERAGTPGASSAARSQQVPEEGRDSNWPEEDEPDGPAHHSVVLGRAALDRIVGPQEAANGTR